MSASRLVGVLAAALASACQFAEPRVRVACVGDSITEGKDIEDPASRYPARLGGLLGPRYEVRNFGVGGATALTSGDVPYSRQTSFRQALSFRPDVVVIALGTNDSKAANWANRGSFGGDVRGLVDAFRQVNPAVRIFVCIPPPVLDPGAFGIRRQVLEKEIAPLLARVARETGATAIDLHGALAGRPELLPDTVHPNAEGAHLIADAVWRAIAGPQTGGPGG